jgi:peptidoglycan/LPS O-acetylase OafA/YrhL
MRIKELDGLRGIAVLAVMNDHYMSWLPIVGSQFGWLGVDLFFVLSGFLITSILLGLREKEHYFKNFYARRALRIFPPYFLGVFVYLGVSCERGRPGTWGLWMQYIFYYTSMRLGQPSQLHAVPPIVPPVVVLGLAVLWSLSVEEIYYTIWAPVVRFTNQRGFTLLLICMIVIAPLLRWYLHTPMHPEIYTFYCRMDALAYGSGVALLIRLRNLSPGKWLRIDKLFDWLTVIVLPPTVVFWLVSGGHETNRLVCTVGLVLADLSFALVTHALIRRSGGQQLWVRAFRAKWLRSVGMVSYSLYLFHYPLRGVSMDLVSELHLSRHAETIAVVILGLILSFAVAYGLWYLLESPILRWKDRKVPSTVHL